MNRTDVILSCQDIVKNLVKKYNNHKPDEDLQSIGMIAVVECVDRCIDDGLTDLSQVQARCNTWARNAILQEIYKEKIKFVDDNSVLEHLETNDDLWETIKNVKSVLTPKESDIFNMLVTGSSMEEVCKELHITAPTYYEHCRNLKKKIKDPTHNFEDV